MMRLRQAGAVTFLVYVVLTLLAAVPTLPVALGLESVEPPSSPGGGAVVEGLMDSAPAIAAAGISSLGLAALLLLLSPFLQMTWLAALERSRSASQAMALGASRYTTAILVTLWMLIPLAVVAIVLVGLPGLAHLALASHPNAQLHDLIVLGLVVPGTLCALVWCTWHDLARAALAAGSEGAREAVRRGWHALGYRSMGTYLAWTFLAAALALVGHWLGAMFDGPAWWRGALLLIALQALAFVRVLCRGAWLAAALDRVTPIDRVTPMA